MDRRWTSVLTAGWAHILNSSLKEILPKCQRYSGKWSKTNFWEVTPAISPGRWGTCFWRWAVCSPNLFLLELLAKLAGCWRVSSKELQASSGSHSVNIFSNFLHNEHIMPKAYLPIQFKRLGGGRKWLTLSNHLCSVPASSLKKHFNCLAVLQISFPPECIAYYSLPVGCRKRSDFYNRE